jgi:hypothetical protein
MNDEEYLEQCKLVQYLEILKRQHKIIEYFSIENENKQSFTNRSTAIKIAQKQKKSGKKPGVSDICIILINKVLFIEMKKNRKILKNGNLSKSGISVADSQIRFLNSVATSKVVAGAVCFGFIESKEFIDSFLDNQ